MATAGYAALTPLEWSPLVLVPRLVLTPPFCALKHRPPNSENEDQARRASSNNVIDSGFFPMFSGALTKRLAIIAATTATSASGRSLQQPMPQSALMRRCYDVSAIGLR
jgi:hypothetical protein